MISFFAWIEATSLSVWVRESTSVLAFPAILSAHAIGMGLAAGFNVMLALRILGRRVDSVARACAVRPGDVVRVLDERRFGSAAADRLSDEGAHQSALLSEAVADRRRDGPLPRVLRRRLFDGASFKAGRDVSIIPSTGVGVARLLARRDHGRRLPGVHLYAIAGGLAVIDG